MWSDAFSPTFSFFLFLSIYLLLTVFTSSSTRVSCPVPAERSSALGRARSDPFGGRRLVPRARRKQPTSAWGANTCSGASNARPVRLIGILCKLVTCQVNYSGFGQFFSLPQWKIRNALAKLHLCKPPEIFKELKAKHSMILYSYLELSLHIPLVNVFLKNFLAQRTSVQYL